MAVADRAARLRHGGNEDVNYKPNYLSLMNYSFQFIGLIPATGAPKWNYSTQLLPPLNESALNEGAVKVFGSTWTAYPDNGEEPLEAGDRVEVTRVQGASIYVRRIGAAPDWRGTALGS